MYSRRVRFYSGFYVWITPVFLSWRQKEAACGSFRFYSAHRAAGVERSRGFLRSFDGVGLLELFGLFVPAARVTGLAARRFLFIALHIGFVMLSAGSTLGLNVEAALRPPQTAPKSQKWKRHCRLSGLSSRCGGLGYRKLKTSQKAARLNCARQVEPAMPEKLGYTERPARL